MSVSVRIVSYGVTHGACYARRHGATSVGDFKDEGFLPDAMLNFLALLGWNDGSEQEIYSREELIEKFSLDRITKSGGVFDKTKSAWRNGALCSSPSRPAVSCDQ